MQLVQAKTLVAKVVEAKDRRDNKDQQEKNVTIRLPGKFRVHNEA